VEGKERGKRRSGRCGGLFFFFVDSRFFHKAKNFCPLVGRRREKGYNRYVVKLGDRRYGREELWKNIK